MIYCIGDSFTYGDELVNRHESAWPVLIGKKLNRPVTNLGKSATGTHRTVRRSMDCVFKGDAELIIVAWPTYDRSEFFIDNKIKNIWAGRNYKNMVDDTTKQIYKITTAEHSYEMDLWMYRAWLRNIILLQTFFQKHNQRYLMLQVHQHIPNPNPAEANNTDLLEHIDTTYFPTWGVHFGLLYNDAPKGPNHHPLEEGHAIIAEKIYEYIGNLGWLP